MHCYSFLYQYRQQVRTPTGFGDSDFSHWEVKSDGEAAVVVPEKSDFWAAMAEAYVSRQQDWDPEFKIIARGENHISAILSDRTRL